MRYESLAGQWNVLLADGTRGVMELPGTLDENKIGYQDRGANQWHPDAALGKAGEGFDTDAPIATRFTRKYTYEGEARISRRVVLRPTPEKRVFLEVERSRCLGLLIDGKPVADYVEPSISTPHVFEVTGLLDGNNEITLLSDNSYPGLPHDEIVYSSAATDETQTNWNGVLGYVRIRTEEMDFLWAVRVYSMGNQLRVVCVIDSQTGYDGAILLESEALKERVRQRISVEAGIHEICFEHLELKEDVKRWDEYEGSLYELTAFLEGKDGKAVRFGVREWRADGEGRLELNGRRIFLRGETNCGVFPETGHPPMTKAEWLKILETYKSYGVNCVRFHSHTPPEAAFAAADELGMLMQPELSHWNPKNALETAESYEYFRTEMKQMILSLANHPSFVMLTWGNELWSGELGHQRMKEMLDLAHKLDGSRLYANGSNVHYGGIGCDQESDFYTSQAYFDKPLRGIFAATDPDVRKVGGYINNQYPSARVNYDETMKALRTAYPKPVFGFEVGQFEVLPDFGELERFDGISDPVNLRLIQERVKERGLTEVWERYVEASGEIARIGYREEIEAAMRTEQLSGIFLLGLQDFPGQGTALVGMLNSHLEPKPYAFAQAERFHAFFREQLALIELPRYTYENTEALEARVRIANFGRREAAGAPEWKLEGKDVCLKGFLAPAACPVGRISDVGFLKISLEEIKEPSRLDLTVSLAGVRNTYPIWVYPRVEPSCPDCVYETKILDEKALAVLGRGGRVYLSPDSTKQNLPDSIGTQFTTDFWSVGTFAAQEGGMGQLIDEAHPIFKEFPTEFHTNWQWWPMASQRAVILPGRLQAIVTQMDSYAYLRHMAQLAEFLCGGGKLMLSSMGLQNLQQYPEARALQQAIYHYMESEEFVPKQEIAAEVIQNLVQ